MDSKTLIALLVGAAISIVSTFAATACTESFKEWRSKKRQRAEFEDERILSLQHDLAQLALSVRALQWEQKHLVMSRIFNPERADQLVREVVARMSDIAVTATRLTDNEARAAVDDIRAASHKLINEDRQKNFVKAVDRFIAQADEANERLGALIRRRMK